ncbi:uncharacterized protein UTRI_00892 [Ustilago trichophora]|uniref:Uncharacterized protein n=1 Tax=Ustilago trichophora TaxID=86804 RepID=A0A5C3DSY2_9BASI|nr:uncharacterized protein UTRI_00892 [Ustilago trichophora]
MLFRRASFVFAVALAIGSIPLASAGRPGNRKNLKRAVGAWTGHAPPKKPDGEISSACSGITGLETTVQYDKNLKLSSCHKGEWYANADLKDKKLDLTTYYATCAQDDKTCDGYVREHTNDLSKIASDISKAVTDQADCKTTFQCWKLQDVDDKCSPLPEKPEDPLFACQQYASTTDKDPGVTTLTYKKGLKLTSCHEGTWFGMDGPLKNGMIPDYTTFYGSCPVDHNDNGHRESDCKKWVLTFKENFDLIGVAISNKLAEKFDGEFEFKCTKYEFVDDKCFPKETAIVHF